MTDSWRIDPAAESESLARCGCGAMEFTGRPMRGFVFVAREGWAKTAYLDYWLALEESGRCHVMNRDHVLRYLSRIR